MRLLLIDGDESGRPRIATGLGACNCTEGLEFRDSPLPEYVQRVRTVEGKSTRRPPCYFVYWGVQPKGPGYALVDTPGGLRGAIADADQASVTLGIAVPDVAAALRHAQDLGGSVIMPPTDNGWVVKGQVKDPAGNLLTLVQTRAERDGT